MIEGRHKKKNQSYNPRELYVIDGNEIIEYKDKSGDCATVSYLLEEGQQGLYADEFRPAQVPKQDAKVIDLSMGIEDYINKICIWGLYDLKHHLGGKDDALRLGGQWQAALRYWYNSVLNYMDGYEKEGKIGVVTTNYEESKIVTHIEKIRNEIAQAKKLKGTLVGAKKGVDLPRLECELDFFENFLKKQFVYLDPNGIEEIWEFDVIISEHHIFEWKILN